MFDPNLKSAEESTPKYLAKPLPEVGDTVKLIPTCIVLAALLLTCKGLAELPSSITAPRILPCGSKVPVTVVFSLRVIALLVIVIELTVEPFA